MSFNYRYPKEHGRIVVGGVLPRTYQLGELLTKLVEERVTEALQVERRFLGEWFSASFPLAERNWALDLLSDHGDYASFCRQLRVKEQ